MLASTRSRGGAKTYELARHLAPWRCRSAEKIAIMPLIANGRARCSYQTDRRGPAECWTALGAAAAPKRMSQRATWRPGGTVVQRKISSCPHCQWASALQLPDGPEGAS